MSVNKIKSLKLQRHNESANKLEDTSISILNDEKRESGEIWPQHQETLTPVHSTPKRSSVKSSGMQEQLENHTSPMLLPCTQDGNEVAWDWQSPLAKSAATNRSKTNAENVGTPKRKMLLQKKRNSNSPLLYKPSKRKIMNNDNQQECFEIFTAEMKALSEQIKTVPKDEDNRVGRIENEEKIEGGEIESLINIDIEDFGDCGTKVEAKNEVAGSTWKKPESSIGKTCIDDLFDESIEDSMVKCSQEVEEKLKLESSKTNSSGNNSLKDLSWHQQSYSFLSSKDKSSEKNQIPSSSRLTESINTKMKPSDPAIGKELSKTHSICSKLQSTSNTADKLKNDKSAAKELQKTCVAGSKTKSSPNEPRKVEATVMRSGNSSKFSCLNNNIETASVSKTNPSATTKQNEIFEIPDDSFDEDFLDVCFDDVENIAVEKPSESNQLSNRYGKFYTSPHSNVSSDTRGGGQFVGTAKKLLLPPPPETSRLKNDLKNFSRTSSTESIDVKLTALQQSQSSTTNTSRKFFKTKSLSTSSFDDHIVDLGRISSIATVSKIVTANPTNGKDGKSNFCLKSSSVSTEQQHKQQRQQHEQQQHKTSIDMFTNNAWPRTNGEHNNGITHFNRNAPRDDGNRLNIISESLQKQHISVKNGTTGSQSMQMCTPEEIERKRREAKLKLEMKRKLQARSKSAGILTDFPPNRAPVKR
ncbi:serine-rich adhesin for platelets-like [Venturia canescens]|uniref:serine-rich adhesin for platelets-like n=1 Tax=Venturia canescens TaxID=32260 RepID=UPI001C9C233B|nr:serine-rich adhesin for platelets-like [Venturia canescens]